MLGDFPIRMENNLAHLVMEDGTTGNIAGSVLTLAEAVQNVVKWNIVSAEEAIRMASEIPAKASGIDDSCGLILPGRDADFNVLDEKLQVQETYLGGECAYSSASACTK